MPIHKEEQSQEKHSNFPQKQPNPPTEPFDLSQILPEFATKKGTLLCNSGSYYSLDANESLTLIAQSMIFVLSDETDFKYSFSLYNPKKHQIYKKMITNELNYHIDEEKNVIKWLDFADTKITLFALKFDSFSMSKNLKFLLNQCLFESNRREYLKDAINKNDIEFTERFVKQDQMEIEEDVVEEYHNEPDLKFNDFYSVYKNEGHEHGVNRTFAQAKVLDRTFLSKGSVISVFKTEEEDENNLEVFYRFFQWFFGFSGFLFRGFSFL